jgi:hypothetical protein
MSDQSININECVLRLKTTLKQRVETITNIRILQRRRRQQQQQQQQQNNHILTKYLENQSLSTTKVQNIGIQELTSDFKITVF